MTWSAHLIGSQEQEAYDSFVARSPKGHILQSYPWGEVKARTGWIPLRLVVKEDDSIIAAISILKRAIPGVGKSILYAPRGPVLDIQRHDLYDFLLGSVKDLARDQGGIMLKIDPDIPAANKEFNAYLASRKFQPADKGDGFEGTQPRYVFRLDITPPLEQLLADLHPKTRYNLRLAERKGVTVREEVTMDDLPVFYRILQETAERDRFLIRSYAYFEVLWKELVTRGYAKLFMADFQGEPIAGTLAFILGDKAWYIYGASSNRHRNLMPNYLLQWTMIRWAKENSCAMYDFRGVPGELTEDNPLYGLYRFKKGFNGEYVQFIGEYDLVFLPAYYWFWTTAEPIYAREIRRLIGWKKALQKRR
ncbi:MAG: lipid II:glycine glycyltransferase FemX [Bacillota bacterium]